MAATLLIGGEDRESAKRRRKEEYRQDLELQMREKEAARQRERIQGMSVNASGWLDPEKRPERFKPLGGVHWTEVRDRRSDRVRPYHTLFLYDREPGGVPTTSGEMLLERSPRLSDPPGIIYTGRSPRFYDGLDLPYRRRRLDTPAGLKYQPVTYAAAGVNPNPSVDQAYNFFATRDLGYGPGGGSIVQPISIPYVDNRPIIVSGQGGGGVYQCPRYNPFEYKPDDGTARELRNLLSMTQAEKDRMRRENEEFERRLRRELEEERRKLNDQGAEARRRMEELRREAEERRREAERQRREAERLRREAETRPKSNPIRPASKKTMLYYDMDDYRLRLIDERKKIEELLKAGKPTQKDVWDVKVIQRPRLNLPPTPKSADRANKDNVREFNDLKYRDFDARDKFRNIYPDVPVTNRRLEQQQDALIRQQELTLMDQVTNKRSARRATIEIPPRRAVSRPSWMDRNPTPFPHVLRKRDKMYTSHSCDGDLDRIHRRNQERERVLGNISSRNEDALLDGLRLRHLRPSSAETLTDDTWLRPSSTAEV